MKTWPSWFLTVLAPIIWSRAVFADSWVTVDDYLPDTNSYCHAGVLAAGASNTVIAFCHFSARNPANNASTNYSLVRRSTDGGATWQLATVFENWTWLSAVVTISAQGTIILAANVFDPTTSTATLVVQLSTDLGTTWTTVDDFQFLTWNDPIAAATGIDGTIYILVRSHDSNGYNTLVRRSADQGNSWDTIVVDGPQWQIATGAQLTGTGMLVTSWFSTADPAGEEVDTGQLTQSIDQLATWNLLDSFYPGRIQGLAQDKNSNLVEVGFRQWTTNGISQLDWTTRRSTDAGMTWSTVDDGPGGRDDMAIVADPIAGFFVAGVGVRRSRDGGLTWTISDSSFSGKTGSGVSGFGSLVTDGNGTIYSGTSENPGWRVRKLSTYAPVAPPLLAAAHNRLYVSISWPTNANGFVLQSATTLASGGDWQDSNLTPVQTSDLNVVTVSNTAPQSFFRLRGP